MLIGDSAYPLASYPTTWKGEPIEGWAFYIGGDTPHVWTVSEVAELKKHYRYLLPVYTRSDPQNALPSTDVFDALTQLSVLSAPKNIMVQWDYETAVDSAYEQAVNLSMKTAGYIMELYGSKSTVVLNKIPYGGYDEASWTGSDYAPSSTADQFIDTGTYDLNDFASATSLWDTLTVTTVLTEEILMSGFIASITATATENPGIWMWLDGKYVGLTSPADVTALQGALSLPEVTLSYGTHQYLVQAALGGSGGSTVTPGAVAKAVLSAEGTAESAEANTL